MLYNPNLFKGREQLLLITIFSKIFPCLDKWDLIWLNPIDNQELEIIIQKSNLHIKIKEIIPKMKTWTLKSPPLMKKAFKNTILVFLMVKNRKNMKINRKMGKITKIMKISILRKMTTGMSLIILLYSSQMSLKSNKKYSPEYKIRKLTKRIWFKNKICYINKCKMKNYKNRKKSRKIYSQNSLL